MRLTHIVIIISKAHETHAQDDCLIANTLFNELYQ